MKMEQVKEKQDVKHEFFLTPEDMVEVFNVDVSTVEDWVNSKLLSATFVTPQNDMRFSVDAIAKFINRYVQVGLSGMK
jgi:hypothetical protein